VNSYCRCPGVIQGCLIDYGLKECGVVIDGLFECAYVEIGTLFQSITILNVLIIC
jgi:hypothetical protein